MEMNLLQLEGFPILQQLQYEEALLRADQRNWCIVNRGSPDAIVMGISGKPDLLIHSEKFNRFPIPLIKRFSGGGTVVVDENTLFVTFICNAQSVNISPFPESIMRWTEQLYRPFFEDKPFALKENDYVIGQKKMGGNAQSIIKNRWLHHTSFLWSYCPEKMDYLKLPPKAPQYREGRNHADFLCQLSDFWECQETFYKRLVNHLKNQFKICEIKEEGIKDILALPYRKATILVENPLKGTGNCTINTVCTGGSVP
jgi:lipoate---protein ligase